MALISRGPMSGFSALLTTNIEKLMYIETSYVQFSYTWSINNFSARRSFEQVTSPVFSPGANSKLKWWLTLYPRGFDVRTEHTISIFLHFEHCNKSEVRATFEFCTVDANGVKANRTNQMKDYCVFKHLESWGYDNWMYTDDIAWGLPNDVLRILCQVNVHLNDSNIKENDIGVPFKVPVSQLLEDIGFLFESQKYTDFTITNEGHVFPVHRAILAARSPVFSAMFEHDTEEQKENRVKMTDITPDALKEMLRYIYTDKVMDIQEVAFDLLAAAEKYALDRLKIMCEEALRKSLEIENAAEILIHVDLHRANELKEQTIKFINVHTVDVMHTEAFKSMITSHPNLVAEILYRLAVKRNGDEEFKVLAIQGSTSQ